MAYARGGLGGSDREHAFAQVEVAPPQVGQFGDAQPTGHDRGGEQGAIAPRRPQEDLDLLAGEAGTSRRGLL